MARRSAGCWLTHLVVLAVALTSPEAAATEKLVFWSSGYSQELQDYVRDVVVPLFAEKIGREVEFEIRDIGWDPARSEALLTAFAAGIGPDIIVGGSPQFSIPLDGYIEHWTDKDAIHPALWQASRDRQTGQTYIILQFASFQGVYYYKRLFEEGGIPPEPPQSWDEIVEVAKKLTRLEADRVVQSGFETVWHAPQVGSEFDWFLMQTGTQITTEDERFSQINSPGGFSTLEFLKTLYDIGHPAGYQGLGEGDLWQHRVAMGRASVAMAAVRREWEGLPRLGVFAPRRSPDERPIVPVFNNGISITRLSQNVPLAWEFLTFMLTPEIQAGMHRYAGLIVRRDALELAPEAEAFMPWYNITQYATPLGFLPGRDQVARYIVDVLNDRLSIGAALELMHAAHQVELDRYWQNQ